MEENCEKGEKKENALNNKEILLPQKREKPAQTIGVKRKKWPRKKKEKKIPESSQKEYSGAEEEKRGRNNQGQTPPRESHY